MSLQASVSGVVSGTALGHLMCFIRSSSEPITVVVLGEGRDPQALTRTLDEMGMEVIGVDPAYSKVQTDDLGFPRYRRMADLRGMRAERLIVVNLRSHALPREIFQHVDCDSLEIFDYPGCGGGLIPFDEDLVCAMPLEDGTALRLKMYKGTMSDYISRCTGGFHGAVTAGVDEVRGEPRSW